MQVSSPHALCLVTQPIHADASAYLRANGIEVQPLKSAGPSAGVDAFHADIRAAIEGAVPPVDAIIVRDAGLRAEAIGVAPHLRVIGNHGVGVNKVDVTAATEAGVAVTNTPGTNARSVAEHTITLMLAVAHRVCTADRAARHGEWHFRFTERMRELHGKTLGVVGFGRIGRMVAETAQAGFGMKVVIWSPSLDEPEIIRLRERGWFVAPSLSDLLQRTDVISLHRPARPDTRHTLNQAAFDAMKDDAIVINTSRGDLIDEAALINTLEQGKLFGAGLDVFEHEPLSTKSPLTQCDRVILAPHVAGSTEEALRQTAMCAAEQVVMALRGDMPDHLVNPQMWQTRRLQI